jgi:hypothetical protein
MSLLSLLEYPSYRHMYVQFKILIERRGLPKRLYQTASLNIIADLERLRHDAEKDFINRRNKALQKRQNKA